jgi:hypothetical protein
MRRLTAYYFMGQDLCIVRRHIREDMEWMKDAGTDSIAVGIHEFQLDGKSRQELDLIFDEAGRAGIEVYAIPSRWAGLVAGWPTAAGRFSATHPEAWMIGPDGKPVFKGVCSGGVCSIYHPATVQFFKDTIDTMLETYPVTGIVWDELKVLEAEDCSEAAIQEVGEPSRGDVQLRKTVEFFSEATRHARAKKPDLVISCFIYAQLGDAILQACAGIDGLDFFGIDGRCWPGPEGGTPKVLFGNIDRAASACAQADVGLMALVETQGADEDGIQKTLRHLPAFLESPVDHLMYYYYGVSLADMDRLMDGMKPLLKAWRL